MSNPFNSSPKPMLESPWARREKLKVGFYAAVLTGGILMAAILIQGCHANRSHADESAAVSADTTAASNTLVTTALPVAEMKGTPANETGTLQPPCENVKPIAPQPPVAVSTPESRTYVVKRGDTLLRIAKAHGTTVRALKQANRLTTDRIDAGQKLTLAQATVATQAPIE